MDGNKTTIYLRVFIEMMVRREKESEESKKKALTLYNSSKMIVVHLRRLI